MLQCVIRLDARLGVVVQHPQDQVFELQVVSDGVARLSGSPPARATRLHAQNTVQLPGACGFILRTGETRVVNITESNRADDRKRNGKVK